MELDIIHEFSEKSSSYFFNLEKYNHNKKVIIRLENPDTGDCMSDPNEILQILNNFYQKLYSHKDLDLDPDYLGELTIPQVSEKDQQMLDAPIQLEEIHAALKQLKKNKCPGVDGLTPECYLQFWPWIATPLVHLFAEIGRRKLLHKSARDGIISLLDKPGLDGLKVPNWRPITLLNADYKIFAKVLANRLQSVMPYLIDKDQLGYMKGRNIADNLLDLLSIVKHCEDSRIPALLISVDFQKAYDSLSLEALKEILKAFGFGEVFISLVMLCYNDI